ncbi:MAG: hypothetical protein U5L00_06970 [Desulfovermiculus sp.]|nr:hypothetical protein [Desulfovermiculus sp.]
MSGIFFPRMHPSLVPAPCPAWVHFLSPGMPTVADTHPWFRPQALPLNEQECVQYARQVVDFANQFRKPKELADLVGPGTGQIPFYDQTGLAIRDDFHAHLRQETEHKSLDRDKRMQGQMNLIMAWIIEEQAIELHGLNESLHSYQQAMDHVLGVEDRSFDPLVNGNMPNTTLQLVPWTKLLPWFLLFLGPQDALVVRDTEIIEQWEENGLGLEPTRPADHHDLLLDTGSDASVMLTTACTGTELLDASGSEGLLPGMDQEVRVFCLPNIVNKDSKLAKNY